MKILCATDLLAKSDAAAQRAAMLSDNLGADVTLLHVVAPTESERVLEQTRQMATGHMESRAQPPLWRARQEPNIQVQTGNAATIIIDVLAESRARLLVLGPHRKRPIRDTFVGTIAEKALATRKCPVLVVQSQPRNQYQRVLLALDRSPSSATAVRAAESLVFTAVEDAQVIHAYEPPYEGMLYYADIGIDSVAAYSAGWKSEADQSVRDLLKCESDNDARYEVHIEQRPAATSILRAVDSYKPDLLVIGTRGRGRVRRALYGSIANEVLREVECDILIVPEGSFRRPRRQALPSQPSTRASRGLPQSQAHHPRLACAVAPSTPRTRTAQDLVWRAWSSAGCSPNNIEMLEAPSNLVHAIPRSPVGAMVCEPAPHVQRHPKASSKTQIDDQTCSHVIVDLYGGSALDDIRTVERCLLRCVERSGDTLLHIRLHPLEADGGLSGVAMLAKGHISIHTWPERGYAAVDVFMCGRARPQESIEVLRETFAPERCVAHELVRGSLR